MDNEQKQIIKKIKKILRLANQTGSEEEAKTAMQMAHDLLAKHHLTLTDVSSISEEQCKEEKLTFKGNLSPDTSSSWLMPCVFFSNVGQFL